MLGLEFNIFSERRIAPNHYTNAIFVKMSILLKKFIHIQVVRVGLELHKSY